MARTLRIALGIEYDGSAFTGWQVQPHGRSVQASVEQALAKVADHPVRVVAAGRTDRGVHALAQVVHFDSDAVRRPRAWVLGANSGLPAEVGILWAREVPDDFHARFSALERSYSYLILNRSVRSALLRDRAAWELKLLDEARMQAAARLLLGEHDFSSFRAAGCQAGTPVRQLRVLNVSRHDELVQIDVTANAFLQHMVRNLVGALMRVGAGEAPPQWVESLLGRRDRRFGAPTAPAAGLYLRDVRYPAAFDLPRQDFRAWPPLPPARSR
ncbi:tRNA pseudouridine(38-40) synthase TruA [soil metagenome]